MSSAAILTGNRCGHDPAAPRLSLPVALPPKLPRILVDLIAAARTYYSHPRALLPSLAHVDRHRKKSTRRQRSERREACVLLIGSLVRFLDLASFRVGVPSSAGFQPLTLPYLAHHAGLSQSRAERALHDLVAAGFVTSSPLAVPEGGRWRGLPAIRAVKKELFYALGVGKGLREQRDRAAARLRKIANRAGTDLANVARLTAAMAGLVLRKKKDKAPPSGVDLPPDRRKRFYQLIVELAKTYPDKSPRELEQMALAHLAG